MAGNGKSRRGFASMDAARQREIASKGGRAAHAKGTAHEWSSDEARVAGRKGGETVSRDRAHMAAIGREGGEARGQSARMARQRAESERGSRDSSRSGDREISLSVSREGMGDDARRSSGERQREQGGSRGEVRSTDRGNPDRGAGPEAAF
jgi:general stress protein YciG